MKACCASLSRSSAKVGAEWQPRSGSKHQKDKAPTQPEADLPENYFTFREQRDLEVDNEQDHNVEISDSDSSEHRLRDMVEKASTNSGTLPGSPSGLGAGGVVIGAGGAASSTGAGKEAAPGAAASGAAVSSTAAGKEAAPTSEAVVQPPLSNGITTAAEKITGGNYTSATEQAVVQQPLSNGTTTNTTTTAIRAEGSGTAQSRQVSRGSSFGIPSVGASSTSVTAGRSSVAAAEAADLVDRTTQNDGHAIPKDDTSKRRDSDDGVPRTTSCSSSRPSKGDFRHRDSYGFDSIADDADYEKKFEPKKERRRARLPRQLPPRFSDEIRAICRKGVPDERRGEVWAYCLGSSLKRAANPNLYKELCARAKQRSKDPGAGAANRRNDDAVGGTKEPGDKNGAEESSDHDVGLPPSVANAIELDLDRTYCGHEKLNKEDLRSVLQAFALKQPKIGYCQGGGFVLGTRLYLRRLLPFCVAQGSWKVGVRASGLL
ncbi:unnamed protein product [Amoebophrya sp. A25]|nr:unnamed protein product [Amoebophrya sp. A25]|eukprot:GSA25T00008107001.1